jgi:hypothetical protein
VPDIAGEFPMKILPRGMWRMPKAAALAATLLAATVSNGSAYNQDTHMLLVDYAWRVMLAIDAVGSNDQTAREVFPTLSVPPGFADSVHRAVAGIHGLQARLPPPKDPRCIDLDWISTHGNTPNWQNGGHFDTMTLAQVSYPIGIDYEKGNDCGIWYSWSPGTAYQAIVHGVDDGDHAGTVLGYWAQFPDTLDSDYDTGIKPTNVGAVSLLKEGLIAAGALPAATVWVPVKCAWKCLKSVVSFSPSDCGDCCKQAIQDGIDAAHDAVEGIDSAVPVFGVRKDAGMGHHINVAYGKSDYDDVTGLLTVHAGPYGVPGMIELLTIWGAIDVGLTVSYDDSDATKNYEVQGAHDGSPNSRHRSSGDWEFLPFPLLPMTPVDNLGWYGHTQFDAQGGKNTNYIGYVLHAIADASVPMHATGTFGWGHRPYEDAVTALHPQLLAAARETEPARLKSILLPRAQAYYQIISDWRAMNPGGDKDVPVRALINAVAQKTWSVAQGDMSVFNDPMSLLYASPLGEDPSTVFYLSKSAIMQQLVDEAVAASIAYLVATGEKL